MISARDQKGVKGKTGRQWGRKIPLFWAITFWVLAASVLFLLFAAALWSVFINDPSTPGADFLATAEGRDPVKFVQTILAAVGGVGAVGYLVIKYRERSEAETSMADQRLLEAVNQLGSDSPQVRIAGVYALADIADTFQGHYMQRVVDILCGYLRSERSEGNRFSGNDGCVSVFRDAAVEATVLSVISRHLECRTRQEKKVGWVECDFDFRGMVLRESFTLNNADVSGKFDLSGVTFYSPVVIERCKFFSGIRCEGVRFRERSVIKNSIFAAPSTFESIVAEEVIDFSGSLFFDETIFSSGKSGDGPSFAQCSFGNLCSFSDGNFGDQVTFSKGVFGYGANFEGVDFGVRADFSQAEFGEFATFTGSSFGEGARFFGVRFGDGLNFSWAKFGQNASFWGVVYDGAASFKGTLYGEGVELNSHQEKQVKNDFYTSLIEDTRDLGGVL